VLLLIVHLALLTPAAKLPLLAAYAVTVTSAIAAELIIPLMRRIGKKGGASAVRPARPNNPTVEPQKLNELMRRTESTVIEPRS